MLIQANTNNTPRKYVHCVHTHTQTQRLISTNQVKKFHKADCTTVLCQDRKYFKFISASYIHEEYSKKKQLVSTVYYQHGENSWYMKNEHNLSPITITTLNYNGEELSTSCRTLKK